MDIKTMLQPVTRVAYKVYGKAVKHSPELLLGGGIAAMVAGTIIACERTTKAEEILDKAHESLDAIHTAETAENVEYTPDDKRKDLALVYAKTAGGFLKLYWPAIALEAAGAACILTSHGIMRRRNAAITAAYTALEHGYSEYRRRVREKLGEEDDLYFKTGLKPKAIEITEKDENGVEKTVKTEQKVFDPDHADVSTFARWFDETCDEYSNSDVHNLNFLMAQQKHANFLLRSHGYLFLNDVYDMLGIPRCPQGQAVGWMRDGRCGGQGFVDFGIHDGYRQSARNFVNGYEKKILLDFNIDPEPIWDKI